MRIALPALVVLLCGCTPPGAIKAYDGPERSSDDVAVVETQFRSETFSVVDNTIVMVDGKRFERGRYAALVLPGQRWIGTQGTLRVSKQVREQYCAFELNAEPRCTYRPALPPYPRAALDQPADAPWRVLRAMTVVAECADTSFALQLPIECSARPLCRTASGFENCP